MSRAGILAAIALLGACSAPAEQQAATSPAPDAAARPAHPPSAERDPSKYLVEWAKLISLKDWDSAYGYFDDAGTEGHTSLAEFRLIWGRYHDPQVDLYPGKTSIRGANQYYQAHLVVRDGKAETGGVVTLRRPYDPFHPKDPAGNWAISTLLMDH